MNKHLQLIKKELEKINDLSFQEYQELRNQRFRKMLLHHFENPYNDYYKRLLLQHGIKNESELPKDLSELQKLPITDKNTIWQGDYDKNPGINEVHIYKRLGTSGTTGKPLIVPHSNAFAIDNMSRLIIRAQIMNNFDLEKNGYFVAHYYPGKDENFASHESLSIMQGLIGREKISLDSTQTNFKTHFDNLIKTKAIHSSSSPNFYITFATSLITTKMKIEKLNLKQLLCGGASMSDDDLDFLKERLNLDKIILFFPTTDAGVIGTQINEKSDYVVFSDYQIVEVITKEGKPAKIGEKGDLVVTNLFCDSYPIIRYRVGDEVIFKGISKYNNKFIEIGKIKRKTDATFGDGFISFNEIEGISGYLRKKGILAFRVQIVKRRGENRIDQPVIRIECKINNKDEENTKKTAIEAFRRNEQMDYLIKDGGIMPPKVEILKPGELTVGKFKSKVFVDETL
jgi:phenylacetate-coenzyme A ligase PaaK-like adenylate-forming protein